MPFSPDNPLNLFIVPTGIGASVGGYAGDATKAARKIAAASSKLIVNPNVVNAACFINMTDNMLYVEGYAIDQFCKEELSLVEITQNKVGLIIDSGMPESLITYNLNVLNAVSSIYDVDIAGYAITEHPIGIQYHFLESGISSGYIGSIETLLDAAKKLISIGATALAVICLFPDEDNHDYAQGKGVDPVAGIESIISHLLVSEFMVPCAHAPIFLNFDHIVFEQLLDKRTAAEYISHTFLPSILIGLSKAPQYSTQGNGISFKDLYSVIYPSNSLGGLPILQAIKHHKPVIAVDENQTVLTVTSESLGVDVIKVKTYDEAVQVLLSAQK